MRFTFLIFLALLTSCANDGNKSSIVGEWDRSNIDEVQKRQMEQNRKDLLFESQKLIFHTDGQGKFVNKYKEPALVKDNPMILPFTYEVTFKDSDPEVIDTIEYTIHSKNGHKSVETYKVISFDGTNLVEELILGDGKPMPEGIYSKYHRIK